MPFLQQPHERKISLITLGWRKGSEQFCNFPKVAVWVNSESATKTRAHLIVRLSPAGLDRMEHDCLFPGAMGCVYTHSCWDRSIWVQSYPVPPF